LGVSHRGHGQTTDGQKPGVILPGGQNGLASDTLDCVD